MAGRGNNSHYGYEDGLDPFPSDPPEWFTGDDRYILDMGPPSQ